MKGHALAEPELRALADAYNVELIKKACDNVRFVRKRLPFERLAYGRYACSTFDPKKDLGRYRVSGPHAYETTLPDGLKGKVDLEHPKTIVRAVDCNGKPLMGIQRWERTNLQIKMPFTSYATLDADMARCLVNLARVKPRQTLLDPFCGSGTILIQAGLMRLKTIGVDADPRMVVGAAVNMNHFGIDCDLIESDAREYEPRKKVDAIVTDLPYGRGSKVFAKKKDELYATAMERFSAWLKPGRHCVVMADKKLACRELELNELIKLKVHKSLDRYVHIFKNA